jgi:hypothetical protein
LGDGFQLDRFEARSAYSEYHEALAASLETCSVAYPEAYLDASLALVPCEEMHDTMAKSCLNPAEPCCSPFHYRFAAEAECRHYKTDGETRDEGIHDVT